MSIYPWHVFWCSKILRKLSNKSKCLSYGGNFECNLYASLCYVRKQVQATKTYVSVTGLLKSPMTTFLIVPLFEYKPYMKMLYQ